MTETTGASTRPKIGVTSLSVVIGDRLTDSIQHEYSMGIVAAGGLPRILPSFPDLNPADVLDGLDGLLLTGGGDVDPARYGEQPWPETASVNPERDEFEIELVRLAVAEALPVLGICRGLQVINVALGGSLIQHLPSVTSQQHLVVGDRSQVAHSVDIAESSALHKIVGAQSIGVNSVHHQGLAQVAAPLRPVAWAEDGLVEAIEYPDHPLVAAQWHPESMQQRPEQRRLFEWLVDSARSLTGTASQR